MAESKVVSIARTKNGLKASALSIESMINYANYTTKKIADGGNIEEANRLNDEMKKAILASRNEKGRLKIGTVREKFLELFPEVKEKMKTPSTKRKTAAEKYADKLKTFTAHKEGKAEADTASAN